MVAARTMSALALPVAFFFVLDLLLSHTRPAEAFLVPSSSLSVRRAGAGGSGGCGGGGRLATSGIRGSSALFGIKKKVDLEENYSGKIVDATDLGGMMGGMMGDPNALFDVIEKNKKKAAEAAAIAAAAAVAAASGTAEGGSDQDGHAEAEGGNGGMEDEQAVQQ